MSHRPLSNTSSLKITAAFVHPSLSQFFFSPLPPHYFPFLISPTFHNSPFSHCSPFCSSLLVFTFSTLYPHYAALPPSSSPFLIYSTYLPVFTFSIFCPHCSPFPPSSPICRSSFFLLTSNFFSQLPAPSFFFTIHLFLPPFQKYLFLHPSSLSHTINLFM